MQHNPGMDIAEIRRELDRRGWTQAELASRLGLHPNTVRKILTGKQPLTVTLQRHIELLLESSKTAVFVYCVDVPEEKCQEWVQNWDLLTENQKERAMAAVVKAILARLATLGNESLSDEEKEEIRRMEVRAIPPQEGGLQGG